MELKNLAFLANDSNSSLCFETCNFTSLFTEWERILQHSREYLAKDLGIEEWHFLSIENVQEYNLLQQRCENFRTYVFEQSSAIRGFLVLADLAPKETERFFEGKENWVISWNFQLFVYAVLAVQEHRFNVGQLIRLCEMYAAPLGKYIFPVAVKNLNKREVVKWLVANFHRCPKEQKQAFRKEVVQYFGDIDTSSVQGVLYRLCSKSASEIAFAVIILVLVGLAVMAISIILVPVNLKAPLFATIYFGMWQLLRKIIWG
ncbi:MAG: hypothetical protein ACI4OW_02050 [Alphaproteobacteria bacterium]